jgi:hypothetical protein
MARRGANIDSDHILVVIKFRSRINGELLTNKNQVLTRWKEDFEEHFNKGSKPEQPTRPGEMMELTLICRAMKK